MKENVSGCFFLNTVSMLNVPKRKSGLIRLTSKDAIAQANSNA